MGVVLHQEAVGPHVDADVYPLGLLSVGAVVGNRTRDAVSSGVHRAADRTGTRGAGPAADAGILRAAGGVFFRHPE